MKRAPQWTLGALLVTACLLVASRTVAFAFSVWPDDLNQPSLYIIEGYIDRAPAQATIRDRIDISAHDELQRRTCQRRDQEDECDEPELVQCLRDGISPELASPGAE
jgi:hypothetical protein